MSFTDTINADIKAAMLAREKDKLAALRDIKSKLMLEATSGSGEVTEEVAMKIVMKLHKQRVETHALYIEQGREDLAADEDFQAKNHCGLFASNDVRRRNYNRSSKRD